MKYIQVFKTFLQRHLIYRARMTIWFLADTINFLIFPFIWLAIYGGRETIQVFNIADIVTYYIIMIFISIVCSSHISDYIKGDIIHGRINSLLIKPVHYTIFRFIHEISYKMISSSIIVLIVAIASFIIPNYIVFPKSIITIVLFILSLLISLALSFIMQIIVGFSSFWLGENSGPNRIRHLLEKLFSGEIAPLVFFPPILQIIALYLPFKYLAYFQAQIYLEQITHQDAIYEFMFGLIWIAIFITIAYIMWRQGIKKYEGVGI